MLLENTLLLFLLLLIFSKILTRIIEFHCPRKALGIPLSSYRSTKSGDPFFERGGGEKTVGAI